MSTKKKFTVEVTETETFVTTFTLEAESQEEAEEVAEEMRVQGTLPEDGEGVDSRQDFESSVYAREEEDSDE